MARLLVGVGAVPVVFKAQEAGEIVSVYSGVFVQGFLLVNKYFQGTSNTAQYSVREVEV